MLSLWRDSESGVRVVRLTEAEEVSALVRLFEGVAAQEDWQPEGALQLWLDRSVYFALEVEGQLAGGLQLVLPDPREPLPCQTLWPEVDTSGRCAHVAILALEQAFRGRGTLFWRLVIEMWRYCVGVGIHNLVLEVTPRVLPLYRRLGWPLEIRGELRQHWGEDCYLCRLGIPDVAEALLQRAPDSAYYRQIIAQAFRVSVATSESRSFAVSTEGMLATAC